jgi:hypothetical protein
VAKLVYAADFNWSARQETAGVEPLKVGERRAVEACANPEPSPAGPEPAAEGVETGRAAPKEWLIFGIQGEGTVQTTNANRDLRRGGASRSGKKICFSKGSVGSIPAVRTTGMTSAV